MQEAEGLERWQIRVPKTGTQGEFRGEEAFVFDLGFEASNQLEQTLRRVNPSLRRGRPIIYRGSRMLEADVLEDEERLLAQARPQDPEEQAQVAAVRELRDLRKQLALDVEARRRELDRLEAAISLARVERDAELGRIRQQVTEARKFGEEMVRETNLHYRDEIQKSRDHKKKLEEATTADLQQIGQQIELVTAARANIDRILRGPSTVELLGNVKDGIAAAAESPLGQAITMHVAARVAAAVSRRVGEKVEPDDAIAAFVLQGHAARMRHQALKELRLQDGVDPARCDLVLAGCDLFLGELDLKSVLRMVRPAPTISVANT